MNDIIFIYITNPTKKETKKLAAHLLEKKLIACANIFPVESLYCWKNKIVSGKEFVLIAKTSKANFKKVKKETEEIHRYSIACIVKVPATANEKYSNWIKKEVNKKSKHQGKFSKK